MLNRRTLLKTAAMAIALATASPAFAADGQVKVVATFSILGDMVNRIGGEHVALTTLVGPDGDAHVYQPVPADAKAVAQADVLIVNGLGFEGWLDRLVDASGFKGMRAVATSGVEAIAFEEDEHHEDEEHHDDDHADHNDGDHDDHADHKDGDHDDHADRKDGDHDDHADHKDDDHDDHAGHDHHDHGAYDPHAWQSARNAVIYVDNITAALSKADPANASVYYRNRAAYVAEIEAMDAEIRNSVETLPEAGRTVVTPHDAFGYFAEEYGLTFLAPQGLSTEAEASAADVAKLIRQIRKQNIKAVFMENISDSRLLEQIANETGAGIGGSLYSDALSGPDGPAGTYLDMMRHNTTALVGALGS
ncbi:MAG: metal ABC transporter substrate-binding protein [Pseudomonadota bacterium]